MIERNKEDFRFSVAMCVYEKDDPFHFQEAMESLFNQNLKPNEIVLVVDGPVPKTINNIVTSYEKESILKVIQLHENMGHGIARKTGLENCSHELVALMDADDVCIPDRFEKQIQCFRENADVSIVGSNIEEFIGLSENIVGIREVPQHDIKIKDYLKKRCPFNQVTVMFRLSEVMKAGGYIDWYQNEDYYLWIRMYQKGSKFRNIDEALVLVRVGEDMYRRRGGWKYYKSEHKLQHYMFKNEIIDFKRFAVNVSLRFILQVLTPSRLRGYVFKNFARRKFVRVDEQSTYN